MTSDLGGAYTAGEHIVITGTGRSGTTFLVQLFTALGFETGFSLEEALNNIDPISRAGLEKPLVDGQNPYVIKSPWFADQLMDALDSRKIKIRAAIIPVRDLFEAAESRRRVHAEATSKREKGKSGVPYPGALWHTDDPSKQEDRLARQFYKALFPLIKHEIPTFLLHFPSLVKDENYLFRRLQPLMQEHGIDLSSFIAAYHKVARPEAVHAFQPGGGAISRGSMRKLSGVRTRLLGFWNRTG